jgi:hypothetical protein
MTELKSGDSLDFTVSDKTLTIEPVPYGNIKKVIRIAFDVSKEITAGKLSSIPEAIDKNLTTVLPLMFKKDRYPFLTAEWVEDNMTVPVLRKMLEAAVVVNGLQDFFDKAAGKPKSNGSPSTLPIPPEKDGSTTSADLVTDGAPKT